MYTFEQLSNGRWTYRDTKTGRFTSRNKPVSEYQTVFDVAMTKVDSTMISAIGWRKGILTVQFSTGAKYTYVLVAKDVYEKFLAAESKGKFFNAYIKHQYTHVKVK